MIYIYIYIYIMIYIYIDIILINKSLCTSSPIFVNRYISLWELKR